MKFIAHRGLFQGPDKKLENHPDQIKKALDNGYDCEIDIWLVDHQLYLGHDEPTYHIGDGFLKQPGLWIHAKNSEALHWLVTTDLNYFWHENDAYTLTSKGWIWAYPGQPVNKNSIQVMPEMADPSLKNVCYDAYAVCSDFVEGIKNHKFV